MKQRQRRPSPIEQAEADRVPIGFRVPPELKKRIETAANESGRSQAQEIELMIQRAFDRRELLPEALEAIYGPQLAMLMLAIGELGRLAGPLTAFVKTGVPGQPWFDVPAAYAQMREGIDQLLDALQPEGDNSVVPELSTVGIGLANSLLEEIGTGRSRTPLEGSKRAQMLHNLAGPLAERPSVQRFNSLTTRRVK